MSVTFTVPRMKAKADLIGQGLYIDARQFDETSNKDELHQYEQLFFSFFYLILNCNCCIFYGIHWMMMMTVMQLMLNQDKHP